MLPDLESSEAQVPRARLRLRSANGITLLCLLLIALGALGVLLARRYHRNTPLERYKRDLRSPKRYVRSVAAHRLGQMGPEAAEAVPLLIELLTDTREIVLDAEPNDFRLGEEVTQYVGDRPEDPAFFSSTIFHTSPSYHARRALVRIGEPAVPHLIESFKNPCYPRFRLTVSDILVEMKAPAAIPLLTETILASEHDIWSRSLFADLYRFGPASLREQARIYKAKPALTWAWLELQGEAWGGPGAREAVAEYLKDPDPDVREYAEKILRDVFRAHLQTEQGG